PACHGSAPSAPAAGGAGARSQPDPGVPSPLPRPGRTPRSGRTPSQSSGPGHGEALLLAVTDQFLLPGVEAFGDRAAGDVGLTHGVVEDAVGVHLVRQVLPPIGHVRSGFGEDLVHLLTAEVVELLA